MAEAVLVTLKYQLLHHSRGILKYVLTGRF